jgi:hypothetical protein
MSSLGRGLCRPEGLFLDVIGKKNLKTFAPFYSWSPPPADFTPPYVFLGLERFLQQQLKVGGWAWVCLHYLFVYL